jgi:hypothetical protein
MHQTMRCLDYIFCGARLSIHGGERLQGGGVLFRRLHIDEKTRSQRPMVDRQRCRACGISLESCAWR